MNQESPSNNGLKKPQNLKDSELYDSVIPVFLIMTIISITICGYLNENLSGLFSLTPFTENIDRNLMLIVLGVGLSSVLHELGLMLSSSYRSYLNLVGGMLSGVGLIAGLGLCFLSAFAEEFLFRGALQPILGIAWTSIMIATLQSGLQSLFSFPMLASFFINCVIGLIFASYHNQNLWVPIAIHFMINLLAIFRSRKIANVNAKAGREVLTKLSSRDGDS